MATSQRPALGFLPKNAIPGQAAPVKLADYPLGSQQRAPIALYRPKGKPQAGGPYHCSPTLETGLRGSSSNSSPRPSAET
jgi:hypothetical protein